MSLINSPIHYDYCVRLLAGFFDSVEACIFSHEVGYRKPDLNIWKVALPTAGRVADFPIDPEDTFLIDDKEDNVKSARLFGISGHIFETVTGLKKDLQENYGFNFSK